MAKVNIPRSVEDPFYRYQMPALRVMTEGKGKNSKTLMPNMHAIAKALDRSMVWIMKFMSFQLGAQVTTDGPSPYLKGVHSVDSLNGLLDHFIEKYVLCGTCGNPETHVKISPQQCRLKCKACGHLTSTPSDTKFTRFILHTYAREKVVDAVPMTSSVDYWSDAGSWSVSTQKEDVQARHVALKTGTACSTPSLPTPSESIKERDGDAEYQQSLKQIYPHLSEETEKKQLPAPKLALDGRSILWTNYVDFCRHLQRDPLHLQSYLNNELGTETSLSAERLVFHVRINQAQCRQLIASYIAQYVTCGECKSLNTIMDSHDRLTFRVCLSCGSQRSLDKIQTGFRTVKKGDRQKEKV